REAQHPHSFPTRRSSDLATIKRWLSAERDEKVVAAILESLLEAPAAESQSTLLTVIDLKEFGTANRLRALSILASGFDKTGAEEDRKSTRLNSSHLGISY